MRGSELYRRYVDKIGAIAAAGAATPGWETRVESAVRQFHVETMAMARHPFRGLRDDMAAEFEHRAKTQPPCPAREVFSLAARLIRSL